MTKADSPLDVVVLGAGFGGLYAVHRFREDGLETLALEAAPDVGGAWYWNRYPGARCDVESLAYCYSFSPIIDAEWKWSERYAARDEIYRYLQWVADRLELRRDIRFNSTLIKATFEERDNLWTFETKDGDVYQSRHFVSAAGPITTPIFPEIEGLHDFEGELMHTARWPEEEPDFCGKRVGVIGTGSSGTQLIPIVAAQCEHLSVFLRTPNYHSPALNGPIEPEDQLWWESNREDIRQQLHKGRRSGSGDLRLDAETNDTKFHYAEEFTPEQRKAVFEKRWACGGASLAFMFRDIMTNKELNDEVSDFLREKIKETVDDPEDAEKLTPKFPFGTKRLTVGTNYLETFNRDNVELVDVKSNPIDRVTENGVIVNGQQIELDTLICASGFDALTGTLSRIEVRGKDGQLLGEEWSSGVQSHLGITINGYPNMYLIGGPLSPSVLTNVVRTNEMQVDWIADLIGFIKNRSYQRCEAKVEAQTGWGQEVNDAAKGTLWEHAESWYVGANVPGKPRQLLAYIGGFNAYNRRCIAEREQSYPSYTFCKQAQG